MRIFALVSLLAVLSPPDCCERRNVAVCSNDPGFDCGDGQVCSIPQGETVGMCIQAQCSGNSGCSAETPICAGSRCVPCARNDECAALSAEAPQCDLNSGRCVECVTTSDCAIGTARSVCDATTHSCRACSLHSECGTGVCAKDDAFASLDQAEPIPQGACVPASRVLDLTAANTTFRNISDALSALPQSTPYVRISTITAGGTVKASVLPHGLPTLYLIGPTADTPPSKLAVQPAGLFANGAQALLVSQGVNIVVEGVSFSGSATGLEATCLGTPTKIRIIRSLFGGNTTAIKTTSGGSGCDLSIESSWIGKSAVSSSSNNVAMDLDSTKLEIVNSVFHKNNNNIGGTADPFGGIRMSKPQSVHIVNSTFVEQTFANNTDKTLQIFCKDSAMGQMLIVNSLFLNLPPPSVGFTYVNGNCRSSSTVVGVASNDDALIGTNTVADRSLPATILVDEAANDLHLGASAPSSVTAGGIGSLAGVTIPAVDMEYKARPAGQISIGAFQN